MEVMQVYVHIYFFYTHLYFKKNIDGKISTVTPCLATSGNNRLTIQKQKTITAMLSMVKKESLQIWGKAEGN